MTTWRPRRPKVATSGSLELSDLIIHGAFFELTVGILPNRINGYNFSLVWTKLPFSTSYK